MKKSNQWIRWSVLSAIILTIMACGGGGSNIESVSLFPFRSGESFGYADREGKFVINPQFRSATVFREGLALVRTSGEKPLYGYINQEGKYMIQPIYKDATVFSEGIAWVVAENEAPTAIDKYGKTLFTLPNAEHVNNFREGLAAFSTVSDSDGEAKWGFVNKEGKVVIPPQFKEIGYFSDGKCAVGIEHRKYGYIDTEGKFVINPQFESADMFQNGRAVAGTGKVGLIDAEGKYIVNPQFTAMSADGDRYLVSQDGNYGWVDAEGKYIINPQFKVGLFFGNSGLAPVWSGNLCGYIDPEGKYEINPQFDGGFPFDGDIAVVKSGNKYGFIDKTGKFVVNPQFDDISSDYIGYIMGAPTGQVQTDYFNLPAILNKIKQDITANSISGVSFGTPFSEIIAKFIKAQGEISRYSREQYLKQDEKIANVATHSLSVSGDFWGYDNSYNYVIKPQAKPTAFTYTINGVGKGNGKENQIMEAIEKQGLSGFTKDTQASTSGQTVFTSSSMTATVSVRYGQINIVFTPRSDKVES